jgi:signal peptidase I
LIDKQWVGGKAAFVKSTIRDVLETLVLTLIIFLLVRSVVQNFKVEGRSMEPTLHNGQYLLINKAIYWNYDRSLVDRVLSGQAAGPDNSEPVYLFRPPERGEIVVFRFPRDPSRDFIKRVIAIPGDIVEIRSGQVFVNGGSLSEGYIHVNDPASYSVPPQRVEPGHFYVLGDNRNNSSDSHVWGQVPADHIIGRAWITYWPIDQLGTITGQVLATHDAR